MRNVSPVSGDAGKGDKTTTKKKDGGGGVTGEEEKKDEEKEKPTEGECDLHMYYQRLLISIVLLNVQSNGHNNGPTLKTYAVDLFSLN